MHKVRKNSWIPGQRTNPRSYNNLLGDVRRLFEWSATPTHRTTGASPVTLKARASNRRRPALPSTQTRRYGYCSSLAAALPDNPRAPQRGILYEMIFALLAGLGLRIGEGRHRLQWGDVDLDARRVGDPQYQVRQGIGLCPLGPSSLAVGCAAIVGAQQAFLRTAQGGNSPAVHHAVGMAVHRSVPTASGTRFAMICCHNSPL